MHALSRLLLCLLLPAAFAAQAEMHAQIAGAQQSSDPRGGRLGTIIIPAQRFSPMKGGGAPVLSKLDQLRSRSAADSTMSAVKSFGLLPPSEQRHFVKPGVKGTPNALPWGSGPVPASEQRQNPKPASPKHPSSSGVLEDRATIYGAWWSNAVDNDGDGYPQHARLNWDPDVVNSPGSLVVFEKIYRKDSSGRIWTLVATTSEHVITGTSTNDAYYLDVPGASHGLYDWEIDIFRSGTTDSDFLLDPSGDADLNDFAMELPDEDATATIFDAWWSNEFDNDGDGYKSLAQLNWDPDVVRSDGSLTVREYIYSKPSSSSEWNEMWVVGPHSITGNTRSDQCYVVIYGEALFPEIENLHGLYDWKIEVFRDGNASSDDARDPSNDPDLNDCAIERPFGDGVHARIADAWWSNEMDFDQDGLKQQAQLNWNADVEGSFPDWLEVHEKIYCKPSSGTDWKCVIEYPYHWITGSVFSDSMEALIMPPEAAGLYDFRIDLYQLHASNADDQYDPARDSDLGEYGLESANQDAPVRITDAWWSNEVDNDGDGYKQRTRLWWDPDVFGIFCSLSLYEKIFCARSSGTDWTLVDTTIPHMVTGAGTSDACYYDIPASSWPHGVYDWKIELYRDGDIIPRYTCTPSGDADLHDYALELPAEDAATGIVQSRQEVPRSFALEQNYPNPFNPTTGVRFRVPGVSDVRLVVYDVLGREVAVLVSERKQPGIYQADFDANGLPSGVYFYRMTAGSFTATKTMLLVK